MTAKIIDGKAIAESIREEVKQSVKERQEQGLPVPG
ncbi:MAG: bifunctional methylenetetrahydrofolate dehydrogenase/methenyltetrahydrofolate cyclohydrolase, partial [Anaerolineaceae bacterium]|nr:bifunctional methylenetetrahydrofolate dehydrogenase/methenyltetrahydrofolate cyclohydrolase [Anaerolineaceae bacterium]